MTTIEEPSDPPQFCRRAPKAKDTIGHPSVRFSTSASSLLKEQRRAIGLKTTAYSAFGIRMPWSTDTSPEDVEYVERYSTVSHCNHHLQEAALGFNLDHPSHRKA